jgi:SAM-dependent methyltransferase
MKINGYCHCCRDNVVFESKDKWLRDHLLCSKCSSIPRQRAIQFCLDKFIDNWENLIIHESSPSNSYLLKYSNNYSCSQYFHNISLGDYSNGIRCENLEMLSFDDNMFDIFITQDVLEHVFNPKIAIQEIMRVIKPGGSHFFTTPKHYSISNSYPRAELQDEEIIYLYEKQFHGNPISNGFSLVTWDFGRDFEILLHEWTGATVCSISHVNYNLGLAGEYLDVFILTKQL